MTSPAAAERPCCPIGARPDAAEIDAALRAGGPANSVRKLAERYGLGRTAVSDHRGCLGLRTAAGQSADPPTDIPGQGADNAKPLDRTPQDAADDPAPLLSKERRSVLDESRQSRKGIKNLIRGVVSGAMEPEIAKAAAPLYAQHRGHLDLEAKILGDIKAASTTVNVYQSADWKEFRDLLMDALAEKHPEALETIDALIEERERRGLIH